MARFIDHKYSLSATRSVSIAKHVYAWNRTSKKRSLTAKDSQAFSTYLLGFDMKEAKDAFERKQNGDDSEYTKLLNKAAEVNFTSPEKIKTLLEDYINL